MLSDAAAHAATPKVRPYKLWDGRGLFLHIAPTGLRCWRLKYRRMGRERLVILGRFPAMDVREARQRAASIRPLFDDPAELRRHQKVLAAADRYAAPASRNLAAIKADGRNEVYFIRAGSRGPIKIGISCQLGRRFAALQTSSPEELTIVGRMPGSAEHERALQHMFAAEHIRGEWFRPTPRLLAFVDALPCR